MLGPFPEPPIIDTKFLQLPMEIRDQIYHLVADEEINAIGLKVVFNGSSKPEIKAYSVGGLSHTCRQIREEYSELLKLYVKDLLEKDRSFSDVVVTERR